MADVTISVPALDRIANALEALAGKRVTAKGKLIFTFSPTLSVAIFKGETMFTLPNDHPDVPYSIAPIQLFDAEGEQITSGYTEEFVTGNDGSVAILPNDPNDIHAGVLKIGASGLASLNYTVMYQGRIVHSQGAQFTITTGAFGSVTGGTLTFEGITES